MKNIQIYPVTLLFTGILMFFNAEAKQKRYTFTASKREPLGIRLEVDAGKVNIRPGSDDRDVQLDFRYDERRYDVSVDFNEDHNELEVYFDIRKWFDDEEDKHSSARMVVDLPYDVAIEMYCKTKAGETEIELGDLRVKDLVLRVLAGDTYLSFSQPNRERMQELKLESKIGELTVEKLGNANFEYGEITGNIGELSVDLTSDMELDYDREIDVSLNIGQTRLYLPKDEAIRLAVTKFLFFSDVEIPRYFAKEGKYYYSDNYDRKKYRTQLSISPGLGTLDIRVR